MGFMDQLTIPYALSKGIVSIKMIFKSELDMRLIKNDTSQQHTPVFSAKLIWPVDLE